MTHQPKSYKKFVATAATATLVASAIVPVASAAETKNFTDVSSNYKEAVDYLVANGITEGKTSTTFGTVDNITRGDAAVFIARALKLDTTNAKDQGFTDLNSRVAGAVNAIVDAGIANGKTKTSFDPAANITRQEMAKMLATAYKLEAKETAGFTDVNSNWIGYVSALKEAGITLGKTETTFAPTENLTRGEFALFMYRAEGEEAVVGTPAVKSVNAVNGVTVEVTFTAAVDKADATKVGQVSVQGVNFDPAKTKLSEDGKTLTLTTNSPIKVEDATVVVEAIVSKADAKVKTEKYVGKMTYEDKVAPSIVTVEAVTNGKTANKATIKLSEPIKNNALVKVNGEYVTAGFNGDKIELTNLSLAADKTHTVEVLNAEDLAGNKVVTMSASFTVSVDAAKPTATVSAGNSDKEILVTFNKSMDVASVQSVLKDGSVKGEALEAIATGEATVVPNTNNTQFTIAVNQTIFANKDSRTFSIVFTDAIKDSLGNKSAASVQTVTLTKDAIKPVATGYEVVKDKDGKVEAIEVNFSEKVTVANSAFGSVVNENGVIDNTTFAGLSGVVSTDGKKVVYKFASAKEIKGKYAISFAKDLVTDLSEKGNKSDAFNYTIDFGKGEQASEFELPVAPTADGKVITVTYPEAVKGGAVANSATDLANYSLAGKPLPTGTTITLDGTQKTATITLPAGSIAKDDKAAIFTVANVKNTAGTKTVKSYTGTLQVVDNVAPVLESAKVLSDSSIELTYNEAIDLTGSNVTGSFEIKEGSTVATVELTAEKVSGYDKKVKVTLNNDAKLDLAKDITIETKPSTVVIDASLGANPQKAGVKVTVAK